MNARNRHRHFLRHFEADKNNTEDAKVHDILTTNSKAAFHQLRSIKSSSTSSKISELIVQDKVYCGDSVKDGFYENIQQLKTLQPEVKSCSSCDDFKFDYNLIRDICKVGQKVPLLDLEAAEKLLHNLKPTVCDHWGVSAFHYIHGGPHALHHFQFLINTALEDIENTSCEEFNTANAQILYKGHQKDKSLASSYRTISSCPFVAKALDTYIRSLSIDEWEAAQSKVQFLG